MVSSLEMGAQAAAALFMALLIPHRECRLDRCGSDGIFSSAGKIRAMPGRAAG
jgi:hypothetical protein